MDAPALLRAARRRAGLTQRQLADRAGTVQPAIARIEAGTVSPTLETLARLLQAAGFELRLDLAPAPVADPIVAAYKRDVDRSLLRANLRRSVEARLRSLDDARRDGDTLATAVCTARSGRAERRPPAR